MMRAMTHRFLCSQSPACPAAIGTARTAERCLQDYRRLELARLEALQASHWAAATSGDDLKAAELVLKVSAQRSKLLGLDRVTSEAEESPRSILVVGATGDYVGDLQRIVEEGS